MSEQKFNFVYFVMFFRPVVSVYLKISIESFEAETLETEILLGSMN